MVRSDTGTLAQTFFQIYGFARDPALLTEVINCYYFNSRGRALGTSNPGPDLDYRFNGLLEILYC